MKKNCGTHPMIPKDQLTLNILLNDKEEEDLDEE